MVSLTYTTVHTEGGTVCKHVAQIDGLAALTFEAIVRNLLAMRAAVDGEHLEGLEEDKE